MEFHTLDPRALEHALSANAYQAMPHNPYDFRVVRAYRSFERDLLAQYAEVTRRVRVHWHGGDRDYADSAALFRDLDAGVMRVRHTGRSGDLAAMPADHPMTHAVTRELTLNDIFRAVHDVYGHYAVRASFGPEGELKAWLAHRLTLSAESLSALWCETRGQASWLNDFGDHRALPLSERPFAPQKAGLPPVWAI